MKLFSIFSALLVAVNVAHAQPAGQPVYRIVAPYPAGGTADLMARLVGERLRPLLNATVLVENRPGANGGVGMQYTAKATPDGTTLILINASPVVINPHVYKNLPYDVNDLQPVARISIAASVMIVSASNPAKNAKEFVEWAKTQKRPIRFGSAGTGGVSHIWINLFEDATKVPTQHIPYKGIGPASIDVMGGQIDGQFTDAAPLLPLVNGGKLKIMGVIGPQRNPTLPNAPTFAEQGYPGLDGISWYALFTSSKVPAATINRLSEAVGKTLQDPSFVKQLAENGMSAAYMAPADFNKVIKADFEWWGNVVRRHKISGE